MNPWYCLRKGLTLSRRHDRKLNHILLWIAVLIIAFHAVVMFIFYYMTLSTPPERGVQNNEYKYERANRPKNEGINTGLIDKHTRDSACDKQDCKNNSDKNKSFPEYVKDSRDLYAQEGMWRATNFMAVFAALQFLVGIPTLIMIWLTLKATRDTLKETQGATSAANRTAEATEQSEGAYIYVELIGEFCGDPDSGHGGSEHDRDIAMKSRMKFVPTITNYGKTPALKCSFKIQPYTDREIDTDWCKGIKEVIAPNIDNPLRGELRDALGEDVEYDTYNFIYGPSGRGHVKFLIQWEYTTIFDSERVISARYFATFQYRYPGYIKGGAHKDPSVVGGIESIYFDHVEISERFDGEKS